MLVVVVEGGELRASIHSVMKTECVKFSYASR